MLRSPYPDPVTNDPFPPQLEAGEGSSNAEAAFKWPPGLVVDLEWAALWSVDWSERTESRRTTRHL